MKGAKTLIQSLKELYESKLECQCRDLHIDFVSGRVLLNVQFETDWKGRLPRYDMKVPTGAPTMACVQETKDE